MSRFMNMSTKLHTDIRTRRESISLQPTTRPTGAPHNLQISDHDQDEYLFHLFKQQLASTGDHGPQRHNSSKDIEMMIEEIVNLPSFGDQKNMMGRLDNKRLRRRMSLIDSGARRTGYHEGVRRHRTRRALAKQGDLYRRLLLKKTIDDYFSADSEWDDFENHRRRALSDQMG